MGFNCTYIQTNKQTHIHKDLSRFIFFSAGLMVTVREEEDEEKDEDEDEDEDKEEEIKRDAQ